jgi:hypothetical protein
VADQRIEKWTRWIDGTIKDNVLTMHLQRKTWRDVSAILEENGQLPESYWWKFMLDTYGQAQAVAVRRQRDTHRDVASLGKLLTELQDDASLVTCDFWVGLWDTSDSWDLHYAKGRWAENYGGGVGPHLDPAIPAADFDALTATAAEVKNWVDRHVAHADASAVPASVTLTLQDIHDAIDVIGELFRRYHTLFTAREMADLVPLLTPDWKAVFVQPWIRPGSASALPFERLSERHTRPEPG